MPTPPIIPAKTDHCKYFHVLLWVFITAVVCFWRTSALLWMLELAHGVFLRIKPTSWNEETLVITLGVLDDCRSTLQDGFRSVLIESAALIECSFSVARTEGLEMNVVTAAAVGEGEGYIHTHTHHALIFIPLRPTQLVYLPQAGHQGLFFKVVVTHTHTHHHHLPYQIC